MGEGVFVWVYAYMSTHASGEEGGKIKINHMNWEHDNSKKKKQQKATPTPQNKQTKPNKQNNTDYNKNPHNSKTVSILYSQYN